MFEPQRVDHSGIQHGHQHNWNDASNEKPGEAVCLGQPILRPVLQTKTSFLVKIHREENRNVKYSCADPRIGYKNLKKK